MVKFRVTPHPAEAQVLQGQNMARVMYDIGADEGGGAPGEGSVPVFLGVVLDQSGSMEGQKLSAAKEALLRLLNQVPPSANIIIQITLFSDDAVEFLAPMSGAELQRRIATVTRSVENISAGGATSLGSGLRVALRASRPYSNYERRVLMITDGKQEGTVPVSDAYNAATELSQAGICVDAWGVGNGWEADQLRTIAHNTGGEADALPDAFGLADAVTQLFRDVQSTKASNVRLVLNTPVGTHIKSVRQVFPSVQDRAAQQVNEQKWIIPIGALTQEEPKFVIELETTPPWNNVPFRILVPTVLYNAGQRANWRTSWTSRPGSLCGGSGSPGEVKMDDQLTRFTGEEEIASLSQEGLCLVATWARYRRGHCQVEPGALRLRPCRSTARKP